MFEPDTSRSFLCTLFPTAAELADCNGWLDSVQATLARLVASGYLRNAVFQLERCPGNALADDEAHADALHADGLAFGRDVPPPAHAPAAAVPAARRQPSLAGDGADDPAAEALAASLAADDGDGDGAHPAAAPQAQGGGRLHIQFCCTVSRPVRYTGLKTQLNMPRLWVSPVRNNFARVWAYCTKQETRVDGPWAFGPPPAGVEDERSRVMARVARAGERKRTADELRFDELTAPLNPNIFTEESRPISIAQREPFFFTKYEKAILRAYSLRSLPNCRTHPRPLEKEVVLLYGPSACGKTDYYYTELYEHGHQNSSFVRGTIKGDFWAEGYLGHLSFCFDDFTCADKEGVCVPGAPLDDCLKLMDVNPLSVNIKGASCLFTPRYLYVTCNHHPAEWFRYDASQWVAMRRRFTKVVYWDPNTPRDERGWMVPTVFERPIECAIDSPEMEAFLNHPFWTGPGYWEKVEKEGWRYLLSRERYSFC